MANKCVLKLDPVTQELSVTVIDDTTGAVVATAGSLYVGIGLLGDEAPSGYQEMDVRGTKGCADDGSALYCYTLRTKWFTGPPPADLT